MPRPLLAGLAFALLWPSPTLAQRAPTAARPDAIPLDGLQESVLKLSRHAAEPTFSLETLHQEARLLGPGNLEVDVEVPAFRPWEVFDYGSDNGGTVQDINAAAGKALALDRTDVPLPAPPAAADLMRGVLEEGAAMTSRGLVDFDPRGELRRLEQPGVTVLGAYFYAAGADGGREAIRFAPVLREIVRLAGGLVAYALVGGHEYGHRFMDKRLRPLAPELRQQDEGFAYFCQGVFWELVDPRGEKLAALFERFVKRDRSHPELAGAIREAVVLRYHFNRGTLDEFIKERYPDGRSPNGG